MAAVLALEPSAPFVEFEGRWESWGEIAGRIAAIEALLADLDMGCGSRVGVMLRNRLPQLSALYAVVAQDRCLVTLNPLYPDDTLAAEIAALRLPVVIGSQADLERNGVIEAAEACGTALIALPDGADDYPVLLQAPAGAAQDRTLPGVMIEMLTSGTTGVPKRVPLTRKAFEASFTVTLEREGAAGTEPRLRRGVAVSSAPLTHIGGIWGALTALCLGRRFALMEKFAVAGWTQLIARHKPRAAALTAATLRMVLDADVPKQALASLRVITAGAAPVDPAVIDRFMETYGIAVLTNYGATEFAGPVARWTLPDYLENWTRKRGATGRLHDNVAGRVVDPLTGEPLPFGEEGVLELRAPQLIDPVGWVRSTDRARLDSEGFLWITGRADGAIIRGGFKVSPEEVARALEQHPAVREAVVIGIPDTRLGQVPAAAIIPKHGAMVPEAAELSHFLRQRLAPYQVPACYRVVADFPRTASMKPILPEIARLLAKAKEDG